MAVSHSHKFGQIIGDMLEVAIEPLLREFAETHGLFLDKKGTRAARSGKKVAWTDDAGNCHDLDFVLERNGTNAIKGMPVAFVEVAWRRYTKHSRNKAQEIQGAIVPLQRTYSSSAPFIGTILAGVFTQGALTQLKSLGFHVLYFEYSSVVVAFQGVGIDVSYDESTAESALGKKVKQLENLSAKERLKVAQTFLQSNDKQVSEFMKSLERSVLRRVSLVRIFPLHGTAKECGTVAEALAFINAYSEDSTASRLVHYEVQIRFTNNDEMRGTFNDKESAVAFLRTNAA